MLKREITFKDFDGNEVTETYYFNIGKAEIAEMELSEKGGLSEKLTQIVKDEDGKEIMAMFRQIISMSVGLRSEDGRRFIKNKEITDNFVQSGAYDVLFMEMVTDAEKGSEFIKAIMPSDLVAQIATDVNLPVPQDDNVPAWMREEREPTDVELRNMSKEEMQAAFRYRDALKQKSQ